MVNDLSLDFHYALTIDTKVVFGIGHFIFKNLSILFTYMRDRHEVWHEIHIQTSSNCDSRVEISIYLTKLLDVFFIYFGVIFSLLFLNKDRWFSLYLKITLTNVTKSM